MGLQLASLKTIMDDLSVLGQEDLHFGKRNGGRESRSKVREGFRVLSQAQTIDYETASVFPLT